MADTDYIELTALSQRLLEAADAIVNAAATKIKDDVMAAARVCSAHASLRLAIADIAPNADAATQEELRAALDASDGLAGGQR